MKYWNKLTFASKIAFAFWTLDAMYMIFSGKSEVSLGQGIIVWVFGYLLFVGIVQLISIRIIKKKSQTENGSFVQPQVNANNAFQQPIIQKNFDLMEGHEFEYYCADLLRKNGFHDVEVTRGSGDQGIDVIAYKDGMKYGIQCKCYNSDIGNKAVQEAFAGKTFYGCHVAAVLTNRYFTKSAKELSESNKVLLWDRDKLKSFIERSENRCQQ